MGTQELQITMLGPSGVGKTTLLAAMYEQFESNIGSAKLALTPDEDSSVILQDRLIDLKSLLGDDSLEVEGGAGIQGTEAEAGPSSLRSFTFGLGKTGERPSLGLTFRDYPGQYHGKNAKKEEREFVTNVLNKSVAVLIPIDSPSLMEQNGEYHERVNRPQQIKDIFKKAYTDLDSPRLIIFAPVKCEKYLEDEKTAKELSRRVIEEYKGLIDYFKSESLSSLTALVITPVQTVGNVVFSRIELNNENEPKFYFRKTKYNAKYSPKDSEQPLCYLLRFLLKLHLDQRKWGFFNFIRDWMNSDVHLKKAIEDFSKKCKRTEGFEILQGSRWLS
jgi:GTPase SAR1 family protein